MEKRKGGLGKGLDALFTDTGSETGSVGRIRISEIEPDLSQPRKDFNEDSLAELARSIEAHGVLQPLLIRPTASGMYRIVAGERRWRAARMAGLSEVPAVVRELSEAEAAQVTLVENLQREDLNAIEEARGFQQLTEKYNLTQEQIADAVGKSRPAVTNALRLLSLPGEIVKLVETGDLSAGHAKAILSAEEKNRSALAKRIVSEGLSVREAEKLASKKEKPPKQAPAAFPKNSWYKEMEIALTQETGRPVKITEGKKGGVLEIPFYNKQELAEICERLANRKIFQ